jgi:glycyl-tRNA synthetase beta chain
MASGELLLEVRVEEVPARMLPGATRELATRLFEELVARGLTPREVEAGFTPRRLWLVLRGVPEKEKDRRTRIVGPARGVAFAADGSVTKAAEGFARKLGIPVDRLRTREFSANVDESSLTEAEVGVAVKVHDPDLAKPAKVKVKGEYVYVPAVLEGRFAREILTELVPRLLGGLAWAKTMRWGDGSLGPWVRPVHGVVALFDGEVVPFEFLGVASGRTSAGHPTLSPGAFEVADAADWRAQLRARGIEPAPEERRRRLAAAMAERAAAAGGRLVEDAELLDKLAAICEVPGVLEGGFEAALLALPREVLQASLRDHQSALTVEREGRLAPLFLTVMDRPDDPAGRVRAGNEWVVAARLADAAFFWQKDRAQPLEELVPRLEHLSFHEKLGHYDAKWHRMSSLASDWKRQLGLSESEIRDLDTAQKLLKTDLTTEMVREFTTLQGVMGGIYAREGGHAEAVWQAIYDQYLPAGTDDPLPRGRIGRLAALADRIDTLVGFFGLGAIPTGSKDPYGLRRAALAVVRLLLEGEIALGLEQVTRGAWKSHTGLKLSADETWAKLKPFFEDRLRYLLGMRGLAYDEIEAGLGATGSPLEALPSLERRVRAIHEAREDPELLSVVLSFKRLTNILKDAAEPSLPAGPEVGALTSEAERALLAARAELDGELAAARASEDYARALAAVGRFAAPLDRFFVEVLVMDPDPLVRRNRLGLLAAIRSSIAAAADLSALVVDKAQLRSRAGA